MDKTNKRLVRFGAWRGPRDEREWPKQLMWGDPDGWPWEEHFTADDLRGQP
jgi:hypothetical protein